MFQPICGSRGSSLVVDAFNSTQLLTLVHATRADRASLRASLQIGEGMLNIFPSISNKVAASPIGLAAEELVSKMLPCLKASDFLARLTLAATALLLRFHQPRKLESAWGLAD